MIKKPKTTKKPMATEMRTTQEKTRKTTINQSITTNQNQREPREKWLQYHYYNNHGHSVGTTSYCLCLRCCGSVTVVFLVCGGPPPPPYGG